MSIETVGAVSLLSGFNVAIIGELVRRLRQRKES